LVAQQARTPSAVEQQTSDATVSLSSVAHFPAWVKDFVDREGGRGTRRSINPQGVLMNPPPDVLRRSSL
jgi:hypothetical protein